MKKKYGNLSVQTKLATIVMSICGALVLLMTFLYAIDKVYSFRRFMVENHAMLIDTISRGSIAPLLFDDSASANDVLSSLSGVGDVLRTSIYTREGVIFADYQSVDEKNINVAEIDGNILSRVKSEGNDSLVYDFSKQYLDLATPIIFEDKHLGYITMRASLKELNHRLMVSIFIVIALFVTLGVLAQIISVRLHKSIAEPLVGLLGIMAAVKREKNYSYRTTKLNDDEFGVLSDEFNSMLAEIETRDKELAQYRNHLESLVSKRTKELLLSNKKLQEEVEERENIQDQLARAQRMEAIGTLAGSVAHDLNNILSGVVSYPELLLMNIDHKDEMYKPLKTIQTSGNKAAAIVQDLLTLARRGGRDHGVVEIDKIINDYLISPECSKMLELHPRVHIEKSFDEQLLNVKGSAVHLSKTIMNLITNAAEAINGVGEIKIALKNTYLEQPIKGYDRVDEGSYVVLQVSDNGVGISETDLKYIFEPFYTKKKMGISGTGLGMAVVWGTVEDHRGYIEVESRIGEGTTFSLYFPATLKDVKPEEQEEVSKYRGNGEKILVVDDVEEQRFIATAMLKELGYTPEAVDSGEEAIEAVKETTYDLVVLDMIMEPGIDGLETFMKIIEVNPAQKAIIATGFAEAKKLEIAKQLGMQGYLRKPYSVGGIAKAIREELERIKR